MKKVFSMLFIVISIILCCISICEVSNFDCLNGNTPIQQVLVLETNDFDTIANKNIGGLQTHKILLFHISILFLILNSIICFNKESKVKSIVTISLVSAIAIYILTSHNYVFYLMWINIYLLYYFIARYGRKNILNIIMTAASTVLCCVCITMLYNHFRLPTVFDVPNIFESLVQSSKNILTTFGLWIIPYIVMALKNYIEAPNNHPQN